METSKNRNFQLLETLVANSDIIPLKSTVSPDGKKIAFENVADEAIYVVNLKY